MQTHTPSQAFIALADWQRLCQGHLLCCVHEFTSTLSSYCLLRTTPEHEVYMQPVVLCTAIT